MLSTDSKQRTEQLLVESGLITPERLEQLKLEAIKAQKPLITLLIEREYVQEEELTKLIAKASNQPYVNLTEATVDQEVLDLIPKSVAERFKAVPIGIVEGKLAVAMLDPNNVQTVDYIASKVERPISAYMASQGGIETILRQYHEDLETGISDFIEKAAAEASTTKKRAANQGEIRDIIQDSPVTRVLQSILDYAAKEGASDIHIEPFENSLKVRCRMDGILREIMTLPKSTEPALVSRIKILSNLKIDEHRTPQDGQFKFTYDKQDIDVRVSVAPVVWGEQVVLRLLAKDAGLFKLENLGFYGRSLEAIRSGIHKPHGMILSSGPTGSGKSTTLYALIQEILDESINIVTLEDPVEYKMEGVNQIQVNPATGLTFASGLRSILRQDPDVVMVGEIRDKETASLAVQAALTGHLVFSTLHTNSSAGVLPRLIDMGIEPFLIASTVNTVIGQRLVRRVCEHKEEYQSSELETKAIGTTLKNLLPTRKEEAAQLTEELGYDHLPLQGKNAYTLYRGKESDSCPGGYKGRVGVYEVFSITNSIQSLLGGNVTSQQVQEVAMEEGMVTMKQDGYLKALNGLTTLQEVERVAADF